MIARFGDHFVNAKFISLLDKHEKVVDKKVDKNKEKDQVIFLLKQRHHILPQSLLSLVVDTV